MMHSGINEPALPSFQQFPWGRSGQDYFGAFSIILQIPPHFGYRFFCSATALGAFSPPLLL
jgi:hypothetical protein